MGVFIVSCPRIALPQGAELRCWCFEAKLDHGYSFCLYTTMAVINFDHLWSVVSSAPHERSPYTIHGPDHWKRVERNGLIIASQSGASTTVVRLFALFHDSKRVNDGWDPDHGKRGAAYAALLRGEHFNLTDDEFELLQYACTWHTDSDRHDDPTIGTCWDADRLDLGRAGIIPHAQFMSTTLGAEIANYGTIQPWMHLLDTRDITFPPAA